MDDGVVSATRNQTALLRAAAPRCLDVPTKRHCSERRRRAVLLFRQTSGSFVAGFVGSPGFVGD